ncbi:DUF2190 family protein [Caulobacter sp. CCNWLY153]|uniref:DUF2190 family protein n=1 Tax=unclassified Caulobacter TaxID=2648921 RepID=UPI002FEF9795
MAKNHVQKGSVLDLIAPAGGVVSGLGYRIGGFFVIALVTAAEGDTFAGAIDEVWTLPAAVHASNQAIGLGDPVFWDAANHCATSTPTGNQLIGAATKVKVSTDDEVTLRLWPLGVAPSAAIPDVATTAPTNSTPYGFSQAQATALIASQNAILAALRAHGIVTA